MPTYAPHADGRDERARDAAREHRSLALRHDARRTHARRDAPWRDARSALGPRLRRILSSIQRDVDAGGTARVRQITSAPFALYRVEVERPDMAYVRTTVMGYDALAALLDDTPEETLRERFVFRRSP
jgi:hypothetical protein